MLIDISPLFPTLTQKALKGMLSIAFSYHQTKQTTFENIFNTSFYVHLTSLSYNGLLILSIDFAVLESIYQVTTQTHINEEKSLIEDFGKEILNVIAANFMDSHHLSQAEIKIPQYIHSHKKEKIMSYPSINEIPFTCYKFSFHQDKTFLLYAYLENNDANN